MPSTKNFQLLDDQVTSRPGANDRLAELRQTTLAEIGLYELRQRRGLTQAALADELGVTQSSISQLENGADPKLSTLRSYVAALGGQLQINITFPNTDDNVNIALGGSS